MSYNLTITAVAPNPREWGNNYGKFKDYTVTVKDENSGNTRDASWSRKIRDDGSVASPQVGDRIEAELVQTEFPPNWKLKNVQFGDSPPRSNGSTGSVKIYPGPSQDEFRRSKEQMTIEAADHTAALLIGSHPQWDPLGDEEYILKFEAVSRYLHARATLGARAESLRVDKTLPENRRDIERTGESDVPVPQDEFVHAGSSADDDSVPF